MSLVPTLNSYITHITSAHRNKPEYVAYVSALVQPLLDSQAILQALLTTFDLDTAVGVQLDAVGQWIGRSRFLQEPLSGVYFSFDLTGLGFDQGQWQGPFDPTSGLASLDDLSYRALLYAKRTMNNWNGTIPVAAQALSQMMSTLAPSSSVSIFDNQDMTMTVGLAGQVPPVVALSLLQGGYVPIRPSGVLLNFLITSVNGIALFGFDSNTAAVAGFDVGSWSGAPGVGPGAVSGFSLVSFTSTTATFSWLPPTTGTGPFSFQLQESLGNGLTNPFALAGQPVTGNIASIGGLTPGQQYAFEIFAVNATGPGPSSAFITFTTPPATSTNATARVSLPRLTAAGFINVQALFNLATGLANFMVMATSSSVFQGQFNLLSSRTSLPKIVASGNAVLSSGTKITINPIVGALALTPFTVTGTLAGFNAIPTLMYADSANTFLLGGVIFKTETSTPNSVTLNWFNVLDPVLTVVPIAGVGLTSFSFTHGGLPAPGSYQLLMTDGVVSTIVTYNVS